MHQFQDLVQMQHGPMSNTALSRYSYLVKKLEENEDGMQGNSQKNES